MGGRQVIPQGTWENSRFVLASTKDAEIARLKAGLRSAIAELERVTVVKDGHPSVSHSLIYNLRGLLGQ